jgi:uncharacterized radical SAM superfamily Fe-S cluster-containing enzyme
MDHRYYATTSMCPTCHALVPGEVVRRDDEVWVTRMCPEHGGFDGLVCSDVAWYERLPMFDVEPARPQGRRLPVTQAGCPTDCGLCSAHRQIAGTAAIEISNRCDAACPVCLADNVGTFDLSVADVTSALDALFRQQDHVSAVALSGGEPTMHPALFDMIRALERPGVERIVVNTNGLRVARDDAFLDELARHDRVYVSLHFDGAGAKALRGIDASVQERALERLLARKIPAAPLVLAARGVNDHELGPLVLGLLRKDNVRTVMMSMLAHVGSRGEGFAGDPRTRLTIPGALDAMEATSAGALRKRDFMPLPMPNPLCAAIGYFFVMDDEVTPLVPLAPIERVIDFTKNSNFGRADDDLEALLREVIDRVYASPEEHAPGLLGRLRKLAALLFPEDRALDCDERTRLAESCLKTVYLYQFMDPWTFDASRLDKCSCQHLLPDGKIIPSCSYYALHRAKDPRFARAAEG